jgi:hypothetical protein
MIDEALGQSMTALMGQGDGHAPTMGALDKVRYTHVDMIDYIIANPGCSGKELALRYGYTAGWVSNIQASDAFKAAMAARRAAITDPILYQTVAERFEGMTALSLQRLQEKLEAPQVSDQVVLRAVELGAKAMGVGGHAPPPPQTQDHLAQLAARLLSLQDTVRKGVSYAPSETIEITDVSAVEVPAEGQ